MKLFSELKNSEYCHQYPTKLEQILKLFKFSNDCTCRKWENFFCPPVWSFSVIRDVIIFAWMFDDISKSSNNSHHLTIPPWQNLTHLKSVRCDVTSIKSTIKYETRKIAQELRTELKQSRVFVFLTSKTYFKFSKVIERKTNFQTYFFWLSSPSRSHQVFPRFEIPSPWSQFSLQHRMIQKNFSLAFNLWLAKMIKAKHLLVSVIIYFLVLFILCSKNVIFSHFVSVFVWLLRHCCTILPLLDSVAILNESPV